MEQEKDWKAEVEADIALKDSRIRNYNIEKQEKIAMVNIKSYSLVLL